MARAPAERLPLRADPIAASRARAACRWAWKAAAARGLARCHDRALCRSGAVRSGRVLDGGGATDGHSTRPGASELVWPANRAVAQEAAPNRASPVRAVAF